MPFFLDINAIINLLSHSVISHNKYVDLQQPDPRVDPTNQI